MKFTRLSFISLFAFQVSFGQTWQDTLSFIDKTFSQYQPENPGCELSISRNGQIIFSKAWGVADLEHNVPLSTNSIFEAGSVSKQFTAAAILLLEQQGKLSLHDDVRKYIPELPDYGASVTLRQMLHHTSGLRDWGNKSRFCLINNTNQNIAYKNVYSASISYSSHSSFYNFNLFDLILHTSQCAE